MWEVNGIVGRDASPPPCAGNFSGTAVVIGSGRCIWDDLKKIETLLKQEKLSVIAVNNMIMHYKGRVHHGVSLHPEEPPLWRALRKTNQGENSYVVCHSYRIPKDKSVQPKEGLDYIWDIDFSKGGTSSLLAVMIGLALGYDRIILAGVPMDNSGHFFDPPEITTKFTANHFRWEWDNAQKYIRGRVKSLSGNTQRWLGDATEWVNG